MEDGNRLFITSWILFLVALGFGVMLVWQFCLHFTLFRLFMALIFLAGAAVSGIGGMILFAFIGADLPVWAGAVIGLTLWCVAIGYGWPHRSAA
jgi:hypothetical protein